MKEFKLYCPEKLKSTVIDHAKYLEYIVGEPSRYTGEFLYFYLDCDMAHGDTLYDFKHHSIENELTIEEFLKLTPEDVRNKREFDLKPFDKVLVRRAVSMVWRGDFFGSVSSYHFKCVGMGWEYIAKYEGNEEYLGTDEDIPDSWHISEVSK